MNVAAITGCDSGIGASLARIFIDNGYTVIISYFDRNPFEGTPRVIACRLDLRDEGQIISFAALVEKHCREENSLDYFINNAGVALGGPFENIPLDVYREVFEINFFGLISLTRKIIPCLIQSRGRLVVNGSMAGRIALPFLSPYTASKFALEGWCDSIRRELNPFGIRTILLEPGGIATPIWNKALEQDASFSDEKYRECIQKFRENFIMAGNKGMNTDKAATQIYRLITRKKPGARYIIASSRFVSFMETLIPDSLLDALVVKMFSMYYGDTEK
jgi:NAD(P)-dependent dehydrogenase (short-subunit alcohol dehydrogenase family)